MKSAAVLILSSTVFGAAVAFAPQQSGRLHTRLHEAKAKPPTDIDHGMFWIRRRAVDRHFLQKFANR